MKGFLKASREEEEENWRQSNDYGFLHRGVSMQKSIFCEFRGRK